MGRRIVCLIVFVGVQLADSSLASACPICKTAAGEQVRAGIVDEHFGRTLLSVALPFPLLLGVVAMIHFGWPMHTRLRKASSQDHPSTEGVGDDPR